MAVSCREPPPGPGPLWSLALPPVGDFTQVSSYDTSGGNRDRLEIAAGDSAVILDVAGPGVVRRIWLTVASGDPHYLRRIALRMYWDGEELPSVAVPLGDFFGNGFDRRHYMALPIGVSSGGFYSYLPMPFQQHARFVIHNGTGRAIDAFYFNIDVLEVNRLPRGTATFHAEWRRTPRTADSAAHVVLDAEGAGHLAGVSLNAESYRSNFWYLEGDERFIVDGTVRGQGTGTEDYFNGGWYFEAGAFSGPFHGVVVKDDERGRIAAYRWHVPDPIPFRRSLRIELEHGHANREVADYATTAYWYQREPHRPLTPLPAPNDRRVVGVKIQPNAVMRDAIDAVPDGPGITARVPVPRPDRYRVMVYPMGGPGDDTVRLQVGDRSRPVSLGGHEPGTVLEPVDLGIVSGGAAVEVTVAGGGLGSVAAVDPVPVRQWAAAWQVLGPFPNPQRLGTEYSPALDSVFAPEADGGQGPSYSLSTGRRVSWRPAPISPDGQVRLRGYIQPTDWVTAYAKTFLYSPVDGTATLLLGADDAHVLWVNGVRVSERQGRNISVADDLVVPVDLRAGWNAVLLKVANLDGGWAFQLRVADPAGDYRWSARSPDGGN